MSCGGSVTNSSGLSFDSTSSDSLPPEAPTISFLNPSSSPGNNPTPTFLINRLLNGQIVQLFLDETCEHSASEPVPNNEGSEVEITASRLHDEIEYTFYFNVVTNDESTCFTQHLSYTLDTTPPSVSGLEDDNNPRSSKDWAWSSDDSSAQFRFTLNSNDEHTFADDDSYGAVKTAATQGANAPLGDGTYYLHVQARDSVGNESQVSSVVFILDTFAAIPSLELSDHSPSPGALTTPTFTISGLERNARVQLFTDDTCQTVASDEISHSEGTQRQITINEGIITDNGPYFFYVKQTDSLQHISGCSSASRYDYNSSLFQVTGLTGDSTPSRSKSFSWESNLPGTSEFRYEVNQNENHQFTLQDSWGPGNQVTKNEGTGTFYLHVQARQGNQESTILSIPFILDNTAPNPPDSIVGVSGVSAFGLNPAPSFIVSGLEVGGSIQLFSDSVCQSAASASVSNIAATETTIAVNHLPTDNTYNFYAKQTDAVGNASNCSTAFTTYTLDRSPPSAPSALVYSGTSSPSNIRTPTIEVQGLEEMALVQLFNDSTCSTGVSSAVTNTNGTEENLSATAITSGDGTYHFYAKQTDRAGNASACSEVLDYVLDTTAPIAPTLAMETPLSFLQRGLSLLHF